MGAYSEGEQYNLTAAPQSKLGHYRTQNELPFLVQGSGQVLARWRNAVELGLLLE